MNTENPQTDKPEVSENSDNEIAVESAAAAAPAPAESPSSEESPQPDVEQRLIQLKNEIDELQRDVRGYYKKSLLRDEIEEKLGGIKEEVDALQVAVMQAASLPWYRNASVIVAVLATVFSLGTALMSYLQVYEQQKRDARKELREVLQRMAALPKENVELLKTYEKDLTTRDNLSASIAQESKVLARQAMEIAERVPSAITAHEYLSIAVSLQNAELFPEAFRFTEKGLSLVKDYTTETTLLRVQANICFIQGDIGLGREKYYQALNIHNKYNTDKTILNNYMVTYNNSFTLSNWGVSEYNVGHCSESEKILAKSVEQANLLPDNYTLKLSLTTTLKSQLEYLSKNRQHCNQ